ncbi:anti-sigma factor antagonist [Streptomyces rishiriensis]|uniref:Anti-sigma factor antagonist n=1 Tax=Streptomyces rishiriensis TaxID=68264 RepID=A0ABU0P351_STRRH|nr:anti-sigma factor antagonist [Streptomyces rishiriensis]MDQ0585115.1 anti-anti-sigma factor [Streptomyces rishiriensis]
MNLEVVTSGPTGEAVMAESACGANAGGGKARSGAEENGAIPVLPGPAPRIDVRPDGDRVVVEVRGELDLDSAEELAQTLRAALGAAVGGVDLELGDVAFCDCSALNVLLDLHERSLEQGKTVVLRTVGPAVERLLTLTGTRALFDDTRPHAVGRDGAGGGEAGRDAALIEALDGSASQDSALEELRIEVVQLRRAMQTRPVIDLARGILMASFGLGVEEAWRVLVLASQNTNTKLYHLARDLVTAVLGEPPAEDVQEQVAAAVAKVRAEAAPT